MVHWVWMNVLMLPITVDKINVYNTKLGLPALVAEWANHWPRCTRARVRSPYGLRLKSIPCG